MRKINLCILFTLCVFVIHAEELSQGKEIDADKNIAPREIVESAVEEAIMCLQQLQGRLMEAVVHRWAEILKDYFEKLLSNQVNIHVYTEDEIIKKVSDQDINSIDSIDALGILFAAMQGMHALHRDDMQKMKTQIKMLENKIKELETA